jgi:1-pyrroline-5-carboxylate dehydrogenase
MAGPAEVKLAIDAARDAWSSWSTTPWEDRAAVFLRAAELLSTTWRPTVNAATMLGQSKTAHQAEIDSACELIDFYRFNAWFAERIHDDQPISSPGRPGTGPSIDRYEGFVYAVTPFNFTAIAGNLCGSPALMGNVVLWKAVGLRDLQRLPSDAAARGRGAAPGRRELRPGRAGRGDRGAHRAPGTSPGCTTRDRRASSRTSGARSART